MYSFKCILLKLKSFISLVSRPHYFAEVNRFGSRGPGRKVWPRQKPQIEIICLNFSLSQFRVVAEGISLGISGTRTAREVACSRFSVVGDERKRARKKRGRTKARCDGRACKTFFNDPLLV